MLKTEIFKKYNNTENIIEKEENIRLALLGEPEDINKLRELAALTYYRKNYRGSIKIYEKLVKLVEPKWYENQYIWLGIGFILGKI